MDYTDLKAWFLAEKRNFPWRQTTDPYAIWVSEVMLQQTQAATVVPYFLNWMHLFPTPHDLADASLDRVLKTWEGLGYYSRARHLYAGAKEVVERFGGKLPSGENELATIKGLGPYTLGAILSFAFHQRKAAVDGNVARVLIRYFGWRDDIAKPATLQKLRRLAQTLLPEEESWIVNEALIELGATICRPKARCTVCPLRAECKAFRDHLVDQLPVKSKRSPIKSLYRSVAVVQSDSGYLVSRGKQGRVMADLYEFPYFDIREGCFSPTQLQRDIEETYALKVVQQRMLTEERHNFTRYTVRLYPVLFKCEDPQPIEGLEWLSADALKQLAFSSGHLRIWNGLTLQN